MNALFSGVVTTNGEMAVAEKNLPKDGADWVELFVSEMMSASNMDDAKARASRVLEVLEKSICARASAEAAQSFHQVYSFNHISSVFSIVHLSQFLLNYFFPFSLLLWVK